MTSQTTNPTSQTTSQRSENGRRVLPEDYNEAEALLKSYRPYGAMIVSAADGVVTYAKTKPLSEREKKEGEHAFASLLYEEGLTLSARILVLLWVITVLSSRVLEFFENRKREQDEAKKAKPTLQALMTAKQSDVPT